MDCHAAGLPECLRCLLIMRSACHIAHYAIASSLTSPGSFLFWLVDSARRIDRLRTPLAANNHCRRGSPPIIPPLRGNAESGGPTFSPKSFKMVRSILGAGAELSR
jgi:hypothetical protein